MCLHWDPDSTKIVSGAIVSHFGTDQGEIKSRQSLFCWLLSKGYYQSLELATPASI